MDHTETLAQDNATDAVTPQEVENQATAEKTYSQKEVDDMMARMKGSLTKKILRPYEDLGDPTELREMRAEADKRQQEQQIKRGEFEKTLQELAAKKDSEIHKRDNVIKEYKVNTPLLDAAARYRSVNPEQVKSLLSNSVRLSDHGDVEVVDTKGSVRYNDDGTPFSVDGLVNEFLSTNPHFVQPTASTTNTKSNVGLHSSTKEVDVSQLDMSNPKHRKIYAEMRRR